jgi:hypothetical protein
VLIARLRSLLEELLGILSGIVPSTSRWHTFEDVVDIVSFLELLHGILSRVFRRAADGITNSTVADAPQRADLEELVILLCRLLHSLEIVLYII